MGFEMPGNDDSRYACLGEQAHLVSNLGFPISYSLEEETGLINISPS